MIVSLSLALSYRHKIGKRMHSQTINNMLRLYRSFILLHESLIHCVSLLGVCFVLFCFALFVCLSVGANSYTRSSTVLLCSEWIPFFICESSALINTHVHMLCVWNNIIGVYEIRSFIHSFIHACIYIIIRTHTDVFEYGYDEIKYEYDFIRWSCFFLLNLHLLLLLLPPASSFLLLLGFSFICQFIFILWQMNDVLSLSLGVCKSIMSHAVKNDFNFTKNV